MYCIGFLLQTPEVVRSRHPSDTRGPVGAAGTDAGSGGLLPVPAQLGAVSRQPGRRAPHRTGPEVVGADGAPRVPTRTCRQRWISLLQRPPGAQDTKPPRVRAREPVGEAVPHARDVGPRDVQRLGAAQACATRREVLLHGTAAAVGSRRGPQLASTRAGPC